MDFINNIAITIGTAVYTAITRPQILQSLQIVGVGMLGIFAVTLVIIGVVTLLNKFGGK